MDFLWSPWRSHYVASTKKSFGCVFCQISQSSRDIDPTSFVLWRGEFNFIILNLFPYTTAHLMIVPFEHTADLSSLGKSISDEMMDLAKQTQRAITEEYHPDGFNLGMNQGSAAGAGIAGHLHLHLLPRWNGDANFMTTIGETRVLPETLEVTYSKLARHFQ
jgi:ATP adenylyltransferase